MSSGWLVFLDNFFLVFHSIIVVFNLSGWIWKKTRKWHLGLIILTALSWFFLGIWYGMGYCVCTDWHWQVKMKMGDYSMPHSYMKYLLDQVTGFNWDAAFVDKMTLITFVVATALSVIYNVSDFREKRHTLKDIQ